VFLSFFVISVIAHNSASEGDVRSARRLGKASLALSICGIFFATILFIVYIAIVFQNTGA